ncbi:hypothetical protein BRADI_4g21098v3 [Brachypodium distachyon]|uniref:Uncharacterized protein n=1 Tax=Brachypodium distachyon TaxID=15368 RepID=A0A2K2CP49_BRADI|nr:hypothetical protein BRADI_4g21098v3 [Brachypodium distachyon]
MNSFLAGLCHRCGQSVIGARVDRPSTPTPCADGLQLLMTSPDFSSSSPFSPACRYRRDFSR